MGFKEVNQHQHDLTTYCSVLLAVHYPNSAAIAIIYKVNCCHTVNGSFENDKASLLFFYLLPTNHPA